MKRPFAKRKSDTTTVGEAIQDLLKDYHLSEKFDEKNLINSWGKLMGNTIANRTGKIYINKKVLFVEINSGPLKNELNMSKNKVRNILQEEFGAGVINEIIFM